MDRSAGSAQPRFRAQPPPPRLSHSLQPAKSAATVVGCLESSPVSSSGSPLSVAVVAPCSPLLAILGMLSEVF